MNITNNSLLSLIKVKMQLKNFLGKNCFISKIKNFFQSPKSENLVIFLNKRNFSLNIDFQMRSFHGNVKKHVYFNVSKCQTCIRPGSCPKNRLKFWLEGKIN